MIDVIIEEKVALFVSAVGVPEKWVVDKLHAAGIQVMNVRIFAFGTELALTLL